MSIEGQGHFFTIYFPGFVCFVLYLAKISGERLQDHWSSGLLTKGDNFPKFQRNTYGISKCFNGGLSLSYIIKYFLYLVYWKKNQ